MSHFDLSAAQKAITRAVVDLGPVERVEAINTLRETLHQLSPFKSEPVDFVRWVKADLVYANDYNPNSVAPPEMKLLEHSIQSDGYTQPIVGWAQGDQYEVVDGFHRHRVGKESAAISERVQGYLPVVAINTDRQDKSNRIAATIRHNRARGKHRVEAMSDIVIELKRRNWSDEKIAVNLGMDPDEILRLTQISGLAEMFADQEFSASWDLEDAEPDAEIELESEVEAAKPSEEPSRMARIHHTWDKWECHPAGFYENRPKEDLTDRECEETYRDLLRDGPAFATALERVITEWPNSCEHYLTNENMNRIAWLGQASLCIARGIPSAFRGGFNLLTEDEQYMANQAALKALNTWLKRHGYPVYMLADAQSKTKADLY